jgi:hypothetical protein
LSTKKEKSKMRLEGPQSDFKKLIFLLKIDFLSRKNIFCKMAIIILKGILPLTKEPCQQICLSANSLRNEKVQKIARFLLFCTKTS